MGERLDELGKAGWLVILLLAFWTAWPLGLMVLAYLAGSGRLRLLWAESAPGGAWFGPPAREGAWGGRRRRGWQGWPQGWQMSGSGNRAFDDYRAETLRRLEEEEREFRHFLDRLRRARDKAEFDQFMAERRRGGTAAPVGPAADADARV